GAGYVRLFRGRCGKDGFIGRVLRHKGIGTDDILGAHLYAFPNRGIGSNKAALADVDVSANYRVGGDKTMIRNDGVVTDVVSAPKHHVVADSGKRLKRIIFEDKAVFPDRNILPDGSL